LHNAPERVQSRITNLFLDDTSVARNAGARKKKWQAKAKPYQSIMIAIYFPQRGFFCHFDVIWKLVRQKWGSLRRRRARCRIVFLFSFAKGLNTDVVTHGTRRGCLWVAHLPRASSFQQKVVD
jgi:hypothetical protein